MVLELLWSFSGCCGVPSSNFFFSSRRRHTRFDCDWSSDVCSSDLAGVHPEPPLTETQSAYLSAFESWLRARTARDGLSRSEERRVGKECRSRGSAYQ